MARIPQATLAQSLRQRQRELADAICDERDRVKAALEEIAGSHVPDQPASSGETEAAYVRRHHSALRQIAWNALQKHLIPNH